MKNFIIKSFCKINLYLRVTKKLNNGYHNIQSLITFCELHDLISISKIRSLNDKISFSGKFKKGINKKSNTVTKVLNQLRKIKLLGNQTYKINIQKNIPHGSGLGGGSSNAADLLNYFNSTMSVKLDNKKIEKLEWTYAQDFPIPKGIKHTRPPFEQWMKFCLDFEENSYGIEIIAVLNGKYIGSTNISVYPKAEPHKGWTGSIGVLKEFRRKGIATALKIKAIEGLLKKEVTEIRTDNEENNPMYKINVSLGFKPVPFSLEYSKDI